LATLELHREAVGEHVLDVPLNAFRELTEDEILNQLGYTPRQRR
jgi:hypothetical protein